MSTTARILNRKIFVQNHRSFGYSQLLVTDFWKPFLKSQLDIFTAWKVSKYGVFFWSVFPVFSSNTAKYAPGKTLYLDTFHAVIITTYFTNATITITTTAIRKHCYYNYCHYRSNLPVTRSSFKLSWRTFSRDLREEIQISNPILPYSCFQKLLRRELPVSSNIIRFWKNS